MSTAIGGIHIDLAANSAQFKAGLKDAGATSVKFGQELKQRMGAELKSLNSILGKATSSVLNMKTAFLGAAAALGAAQAWNTIKGTADHVDRIGKASLRLGTTVEEMSALAYAAGQSGIEFDTLANLASKAAKNVAEMVANGTTVAKVGRMNVELTDTFGRVRGIAQLLPDLAKGIESAGSEAEQLRLSQKFFGKAGGDQFVTWLKESGTFVKGLAEQFQYAQRLGAIFTEDQFVKLRALGDSVSNLGSAWMGVKVKLVTEIAPAITGFLDATALQLANMPHLVRASLSAFGSLGGADTEQRRAAQRALADMRDASIDLLRTGVIELGKLAGAAFVDAIRFGIQAIAPFLTDVFRDVLAPVLSGIPGLSDFPKSERGKLADLRDALARAESPGSQARLSSLRSQLAGLNSAGGFAAAGMGMGGGADPRARIAEEIRVLGADAERLRRAIATQEAIVQTQDAGRLQALASAFSEFGAGMASAADQFTSKLEPKLDAIAQAKDQLLTFAPEDQVSLLPQQSFPDLFRMLEDVAVAVKEKGLRMGEGLAESFRSGWKTVKKQWGEEGKVVKDLLKEAEQIRFEIYPEARANAEIARIRKLQEMLNARGFGAALDDDLAEARIAMVIKDLEEAQRKATELEDTLKGTFGGEVRDAIRGFSANVGDAFADLALEGKASFEDLARSFSRMLTSMFATKLLFEPLLGFIGQGIGQAVNAGGAAAGGSQFVGPVQPSMSGMAMAGGVTVNVIDQRSGGSPVEVQDRTGPNGRTIDLVIKDSVKKLLRSGELDRDMRIAYGAGRSGRV